jgi:hypothetical protein
MKLTKTNIKHWKKELDKEAKIRMPKDWQKLSNTLCDNDWLTDYLGEDTVDVVSAELSYMDYSYRGSLIGKLVR